MALHAAILEVHAAGLVASWHLPPETEILCGSYDAARKVFVLAVEHPDLREVADTLDMPTARPEFELRNAGILCHRAEPIFVSWGQ